LSESEPNEGIRSMADLLRSGATLTDLACPACSSPIFRLRSGDLWCAKCHKMIVIVKEGEEKESAEHLGESLLESLESTLSEKIKEVNGRIREEQDIEQLLKLGEVLSMLLENLERAKKIPRRR